jgi:uncharacterized membrane protein
MSQTPPPPPPPGDFTPQPAGQPAFSVGNAVGYGWNAYWKNIGPMLLITIVIVAVQIVVGLVGQVSGKPFVAFVFNLIGWIVGMILAFGLYRASLAVVRGQTPEVGMLFETDGLGSFIVAAILYGLMVFFGLIFCIIPGIILAIMFMFYGYLIVEDPTLGPTDALSKAQQLTKGRLGELFVFGLALFGINLVGALICGVGLLFTYGITAIAVAYAYRTLNGEPVAPLT